MHKVRYSNKEVYLASVVDGEPPIPSAAERIALQREVAGRDAPSSVQFCRWVVYNGPREAKPRAAVAGLLCIGTVRQAALEWVSTLGTWVLPSTWPVRPKRTKKLE